MDESTYRKIIACPAYQQLVSQRQSLSNLLTIVMLVLYIGFILLMSLAPVWLGAPLTLGSHVSRGIPIGVGLIVISFVLTGVYVWKANTVFDRLTQQIKEEVNNDA